MVISVSIFHFSYNLKYSNPLSALSIQPTDTGSDDVSSASSQVSRGSQATHPSEASRGSQVNPGTQSTQALSQFRGSRMSDRVRAVAFLTLGEILHLTT